MPMMIDGSCRRNVHLVTKNNDNHNNYGKRMTQRIPLEQTTPLLLLLQQQQQFAQLRGGGMLGTGGSSTSGIRFAPPIRHAASKTAPPTSTPEAASTVTDVKEQIDAFLTRDSRNTFIGMYLLYV